MSSNHIKIGVQHLELVLWSTIDPRNSNFRLVFFRINTFRFQEYLSDHNHLNPQLISTLFTTKIDLRNVFLISSSFLQNKWVHNTYDASVIIIWWLHRCRTYWDLPFQTKIQNKVQIHGFEIALIDLKEYTEANKPYNLFKYDYSISGFSLVSPIKVDAR